jgi:hypothetical protein
MLSYIKDIDKKYDCFYDLINNETICKADYPDFLMTDIDWLLSNGYLVENVDGHLVIVDDVCINLLKSLYLSEVISYWKFRKSTRDKINEMIKGGLLCSESSLFSRLEQDYFNYHLNKSDFDNSLDLRNKYIHGTQPPGDPNSEEHEGNYYKILKLLVLIIIKINDDLCTDYKFSPELKL